MKKQLLFYFFFLYSLVVLAQQSYYNDVNLNLTGISLKNALITKITTTHTNNLTYSNVWDSSMITDVNPMNSAEVLLIYGWENGTDGDGTNDRERGINQNGGAVGDWNREHVYANSLATPDLDQGGQDGPPYADAHNLRPCDTQRNSSRGNKLFIDGSGNSGAVSTGWYPGDEWKGDVARMMMYMYLRYDTRCLPSNVGIGDNSATPDDMIDLFLEWNAEDPVSDIEVQRNNYHGNDSNAFAQGNRNPFIDNPRLATRIWGGPEAEDIWGIYTSTDNQAPSIPANLMTSNITTTSIDLSWDASTDNVGVSSYDIYVDGNLNGSTSNTNYTISNLASNTSFSLTVVAKDIAENESSPSAPLNAMTLEDNQAPTVPMNIVISNETNVSFKVTWDASTDDTGVSAYDVYLGGVFNSTTSNTTYTVNSLTASTTYSVTVLAKDAAGNSSAQSTPVNATTTDGGTGGATEIFISEYVEGSSNNKAIEIVNVTQNAIDLSDYNLRRQANGAGAWSTRFDLSGILNSGEVVVVINGSASDPTLLAEADITVPNNAGTNFGEPLNFNGNDPVGLFKDETLIDIIGVFDGGSGNFAKDVTLRRKPSVIEPNTTFDEVNEWNSFPQDTFDDIGSHTSTLSTTNFEWNELHIYPNPTSLNYIFIKNNESLNVQVFNILGKRIKQQTISNSNQRLDLSNLSNGIYLLKISDGKNTTTRKIIKR
ncbi:endonuclease [Pseudotenacibaculum sp. MALMAid0570]|uniref:endonuclease n=1 Tax=Pseudotenacibaculum sp. MALMAid0570 TaxID=3143938 RepID=UPI0032DFA23D